MWRILIGKVDDSLKEYNTLCTNTLTEPDTSREATSHETIRTQWKKQCASYFPPDFYAIGSASHPKKIVL